MDYLERSLNRAKHVVNHIARTIKNDSEQRVLNTEELTNIVSRPVENSWECSKKASSFSSRLFVTTGVVLFFSLNFATVTSEGVNIDCKFETSSSSCIIKWDTHDRETTDLYIDGIVTASCTQKFIEHGDSVLYNKKDVDLYRSSYTEFGECQFEMKTIGNKPKEVNITSRTNGLKAGFVCGKPLQECLDKTNTFFILQESDAQNNDNGARGGGTSTGVLVFVGMSFRVLKVFG